MRVAQRGTSITAVSAVSGVRLIDRWYQQAGGLGTWTITQEADAPAGTGLTKSMKYLCTTATASPTAGQYQQLQQSVEGQDVQRLLFGTLAAKSVTAQFWVKSNVTGTYVFEVIYNDGSTTRQISRPYTVNASGVWEKKVIHLPGSVSTAILNDSTGALSVGFWLGAGSNFTSGSLATSWQNLVQSQRAVGQTNVASATNNYWQITGVQMEVAAEATEFEHRSYADELLTCQRYFERWSSAGGNFRIGMGQCVSTTRVQAFVQYMIRKRVAPTIAFSAANTFAVTSNVGGAIACTAVASANVGTVATLVLADVAAGLAAGDASQLLDNNAAATLDVAAEI
jgi:hypothetical protein